MQRRVSRPSVRFELGWHLAVPAAVSGVLGIYQLGAPSLWIDEALTAWAIDQSYRDLLHEIQFGHFALVKTWAELAGTSEVALRLPSVVGGVVAVLLMYGLARTMFDERIGFVAALLLALNPFVVMWSQQARAYSIVVALVIAATWLLLRALEKNGLHAWAAYVVVLICLIFWQTFSALVFLPAHVLMGWRSWGARISWCIAAAYSVPWFMHIGNRHELELPTSWIQEPTVGDVVQALTQLSGALGIGLALAIVGMAFAERYRALLGTWALLPLVLSLVASLIDPVFVSRYLIVSCPAFAMLGAIALARLTGRLRAVAVVAVSAGTIVGLVLWYSPDGSDNWNGENWRAATAMVMRDGGARVVPKWAETPYTYYGGRLAETGWVIERLDVDAEEFEANPHVRAQFGEKLRVLRRPSGP